MPNQTFKKQKVKCIVWDLDNTLWDGVLLEDGEVKVREEVVNIIREMDNRGILQSIASRNDYELAMEKLIKLGLGEYFLYPQITWNSKSSSIKLIAESINIGIDSIAFIDDQPFEREEVQSVHPDVLCIDPLKLSGFLERDEFFPEFITDESKNRRKMYLDDIQRRNLEEHFEGPQEEFLASLNMELFLTSVQKDDLKRAVDLTVRTNQLNTTGYTYSYEELEELSRSKDHKLFIAELKDKYGSYGKIGLVLLSCEEGIWRIKLLLMSCRIMSRGIGSVIISFLCRMALQHGVRLLAEFVQTDRNRMMYVTYRFSGFHEIGGEGERITFEHDLKEISPVPSYVKLVENLSSPV